MSDNRRKSKRYYYDYYGRQMTPDLPMNEDNYSNQPLTPMGQQPLMSMDILPGIDVDMDMGMNIGMDGMPVATLPINVDFAKAYVPIQTYTMAFSPQEALKRGTLFPELYQPQFYIKPIPRG